MNYKPYANLRKSQAINRIEVQYGLGAKLYLPIANWNTILKCLYLDFLGYSIADVLYLTKHPAQIHYGIYDLEKNSLHEQVERNTEVLYSQLQLDPSRPAKIIHLGCGIGGSEIQMAKKYKNWNFVGVSLSKSQITIGNELIKKYKLENRIALLNANYLDMPQHFKNSFDGVIAIESLCYTPKRQLNLLYKNIFRILKTGSRLAIHDGYFIGTKDKSDEKQYETFLQGWDLPQLTKSSEHIDAAQKAGFKLATSTQITKQIIDFANKLKIRARLGKLLIGFTYKVNIEFLNKLGAKRPDAINFAETGIVQDEMFKKNILEYRRNVFIKE